MSIDIRILGSSDFTMLANAAPGVFDHPIDAQLCQEFLNDPRHHLAIAIESEIVVGMASAVHYVHPDKQPQLWINELAVAPTHQKLGIGSKLRRALLAVGRLHSCTEAWVLTDRSNTAAMRLYESCGGANRDQVMFSFSLKQ
jgi:ribosomal protein S18 acetylase RimI-like enzyme